VGGRWAVGRARLPVSVPAPLLIARRELASALCRPRAAVLLWAWLALVANLSLWLDDVLAAGVASMARPHFWFGAALLLWVPAVSTRSLTGTARRRLLTLPVSPLALVVGHWLAHVVFVGLALGLTLGWPLALAAAGPLDPGPVVAGYLGLWAVGAALCAVGVAAAAWLDSAASAFVVTLVVGGGPWLVGVALPLVPARWVGWVQPLSAAHHLERMAAGAVEPGGLAAIAAVAVIGLRLAVHALHHRRLAA